MTAPLPRHLRELHTDYADALAPIWNATTGLTVDIKVPARITLAPERTRCRECRCSFGDLILLEMYCSYGCAGLPEPVSDAARAPRYCVRAARSDERGEWAFKMRYRTARDAEYALREGMVLYRCQHCFFLHLGNQSAGPRSPIAAAPVGATALDSAVTALLAARRAAPTAANVAAAKRDARAVMDAVAAFARSRR